VELYLLEGAVIPPATLSLFRTMMHMDTMQRQVHKLLHFDSCLNF
jgi:hypothetical protein